MVIMDEIDEKAIDVFTTKIGDTFNLLSDEAKGFIKSNLDEDDIDDFERLLEYYQFIIKDRFFIENEDEYDYNTIKNLKFLVELLKIYLQ
jgi:hypothetical protein